jgi:hypothetical protein
MTAFYFTALTGCLLVLTLLSAMAGFSSVTAGLMWLTALSFGATVLAFVHDATKGLW